MARSVRRWLAPTVVALCIAGFLAYCWVVFADGEMRWYSKGYQTDAAEGFAKASLNINSTDAGGQTALMNAAAWGNVELVSFLLAHGADANRLNNAGETPLILAVEWAQKRRMPTQMEQNGLEHPAGDFQTTVGLLLAYGADPYGTDKSGQSALSIATAEKETGILALLRQMSRR